jgi:hypothetical protein
MVNEQVADPAADALEAGLEAMMGAELAANEQEAGVVSDLPMKEQNPAVDETEQLLGAPPRRGLIGVADPQMNRRSTNRYPARWRASGQRLDGQRFTALTEDISASGVLFKSSERLAVGTRAYLKLRTYCFGIAREIVVGIEVKHASLAGDTYRTGARFTTVTPKDKRFFERYAVGANPHIRKNQ